MAGRSKGRLGDPAAGGGGTGVPEIEITLQMIEAGLEAYSGHNEDYEDRAEIVRKIFEAMLAARLK